MIVYDSIKNRIPKVLAIKKRENNEFLIVESADLQIFHLNETAKDFIELCNEKRLTIKNQDINRLYLKEYE